MQTPATNRLRGGAFALVAAALIAAQPPLSSPAARQFSPAQFVFLTQIGLLLSIPFLLATRDSREDFVRAFGRPASPAKFAAIFAVGAAALALYTVSLGGAHPVVVVAILCLAPFWAALVARIVTKTPIPASPGMFFACLAVSFLGATAVAWSQAGDHAGLAAELLRGSWLFAVPIPLFASLTGTLTGKWFSDLNASGVIAANVLIGALALIPVTLAWLLARGEPLLPQLGPTALMIVGIILADAVGRVFSQKALQATDNDNGFVTMFQNLEPAIAALLSFVLSFWFSGLGFAADRVFFAGLAVSAGGLFLFSWRSLRGGPPGAQNGRLR
ncbi:hypothetical protein [Roseiarcus fermentans]|nr:hypothetical protein [Roseiarcus fermentans]